MTNLKEYRIYEGLRIAFSLTFIGGFLDAYSFKMLGGRFASMQSGNLIYFSLNIIEGNYRKAILYLFPVLSFLCGSMTCIFIKRYMQQRNFRWHITACLVELVGFILLSFLSTRLNHEWLIVMIAFIAAIQAESFKRLRGMSYGTIMSTGNVKNLGIFLVTGFLDHDHKTIEKARNSFFAILFFILGAVTAAFSTNYLSEYALLIVCLPLILILVLLILEHFEQKKSLKL